MNVYKRYILQRIRECNRKLTVEVVELDRRVKEIVAPYTEVMERLEEISGLHDRILEDIVSGLKKDKKISKNCYSTQ